MLKSRRLPPPPLPPFYLYSLWCLKSKRFTVARRSCREKLKINLAEVNPVVRARIRIQRAISSCHNWKTSSLAYESLHGVPNKFYYFCYLKKHLNNLKHQHKIKTSKRIVLLIWIIFTLLWLDPDPTFDGSRFGWGGCVFCSDLVWSIPGGWLLLLVWVWAMLLPRSPPGWSAGGWPVVQVPYRLDHWGRE